MHYTMIYDVKKYVTCYCQPAATIPDNCITRIKCDNFKIYDVIITDINLKE